MGKPFKIRFCAHCGKQYTGGGRHIGRKYCTHACYSKAVVGIVRNPVHMIGERNWNWRGGVSKNCNYKHYRNKKYSDWRTAVFERDDYTCKDCGIRSGIEVKAFLHAHHLKSYTRFKELRYDIDNGVTLCVECHKKRHKKNIKLEVQIEHENFYVPSITGLS